MVSEKLYVPRMLTMTERDAWSTATKYVRVSGELLITSSLMSSGLILVRLPTNHFRMKSELFEIFARRMTCEGAERSGRPNGGGGVERRGEERRGERDREHLQQGRAHGYDHVNPMRIVAQ